LGSPFANEAASPEGRRRGSTGGGSLSLPTKIGNLSMPSCSKFSLMLRGLAATLLPCAVPASAQVMMTGAGRGTPTSVAAPVNTVAPVITTPSVQAAYVVQGQTLTATNGTWTGSPTFSCQWQRAGVNISGATTCGSYTAQSADDADAITEIVTGTNGGGSANATSSNSITGIEGTVFLNENWATQDSWTTSMSWTYPGGSLTLSSAAAFSFVERAISGMTAGDTYRLIWTISSVSAGSVETLVTGASNPGGTTQSTTGTFTDNIVAPASPTGVAFITESGPATMVIKNLLVVQR
jgi:hypothetical protein